MYAHNVAVIRDKEDNKIKYKVCSKVYIKS